MRLLPRTITWYTPSSVTRPERGILGIYNAAYNKLLCSRKSKVSLWCQARIDKRRWIDERVRRGIRSRALVFEASPDTDHAKDLREVRLIRNIPSAPIAMQTYGKKTVVWLLKDALALQIADPDIVRLLRNFFDTAWLKAEPFRPRIR